MERGSHEKTTHLYVILMVFLLVTALTRRAPPSALISYIVAFYLLAWALISTNAFFGSSFFVSLALALAGGAVVLWRSRSPSVERAKLNRLIYTTTSGIAGVFIFVNYVYRPARHNFSIVHTLVQRMSVLFLSVEVQTNPYASISAPTGAAWVASWVYPLLTSFDIFIAVVGLGVWIWLAFRFFRQRVREDNWSLLLLWLFAAAFAVEVALSVVVDFSGFLAGNLQIRIFPLFMLFAIPLVVVGTGALIHYVRPRSRIAIGIVVSLLVLVFAATGMLKATNDPVVSNKWVFWDDHEQNAVVWASNGIRGQEVWIGFDERLLVMQTIKSLDNPQQHDRFVAQEIISKLAVRADK